MCIEEKVMRAPQRTTELQSTSLKGCIEVLKIVTSENFLSIYAANICFWRWPYDTGHGAATKTDGKDEDVEQFPEFPLTAMIVPEDGVADHHVTEDGNNKRAHPCPCNKGDGDELEGST